jgi:amino acid transporter
MYLRFLSFSRVLWTPLPHVSLATPCVTIWTLLYLSYLVYFLLPSFYYIYSHVPSFRLKQFTPPLYPQLCDCACNCDCDTATAILRSPSPRLSFNTATLYCVTATVTAFTASCTSFHILFANPGISPLLVDCDCDASERPRLRNRDRDYLSTATVWFIATAALCLPRLTLIAYLCVQ